MLGGRVLIFFVWVSDRMFDRKFVFAVLFVIFATLALETRHTVEARYLPTRSNSDRVDKLKELLKDVSFFEF